MDYHWHVKLGVIEDSDSVNAIESFEKNLLASLNLVV